ncbi:MAG: helix-turn-helix transcriptional regulator [Actinobacteria bacterium]|nr:helix-turn-helix transcriptional regulator [Actinomycetota bacterium]MBI3687274.1 helix-turn-helix transcriptional regulator [Actinomycetota bacterium]
MPVQSNGAAIAAIREKAGLTKADLARLVTEAGVPVSKQHIGDVESGRRHASPGLRNVIAQVLHAPVTAIETYVPDEAVS